ncbi:hypothetical protein THER5_1907 [Bifidobacterium thermacidophilum subsp. thermacidophilum]|uniref:Uncharacterized protein n=1 Tax=Bifidobacterium thermacidophilum subsp. thermacidophilum TaxID=79262 RepID=A0A087E2I8_9BIFI|nr:hypothetical protein THER5_1907 [Bifidobacterium thermacidophilum subsp. thermacidophilum]
MRADGRQNRFTGASAPVSCRSCRCVTANRGGVQLWRYPPLMQNHIVARAIVAVPFILTQTGYADGRLRVTSL